MKNITIHKNVIIEFGIVFISVLLAFLIASSDFGKMIDLKIYDIFIVLKPKPKEWNKIIYVNIDDRSIDVIGRWPWPRYEIAKGVDVLKEFGADKILLDIEFIDPSLDVLNYDFYELVMEENALDYSFGSLYDDLIIQPDKMLARSFIQGSNNVYLACRGVKETEKKRTDIQADEFKELQKMQMFFIPLKNAELSNYLPVDKYMESPFFPLYLGAKGMGFTIAEKDSDGVLRTIDLFRIFNQHLIPQLSLPVIMDNMEIDKDNIEVHPGNYIRLNTKQGEKIDIPVTKDGKMYINWTSKWSKEPFGPHVSFSLLVDYYNQKELVKNQLPYLDNPNLSDEDRFIIKENVMMLEKLSNTLTILKDKITITGVTAESTTDVGATSLDSITPLVLVQANIMNTIYNKAFLRKVPEYINYLFLIILVVGIYIFGLRLESALTQSLVSFVIVFAQIILSFILISFFGIILNYSLILFGGLMAVIFFIAYKFVLYDTQKNYIKKAFMQYLSPEVVQQVVDNPDLLKLGGQKMEITAYFSDVEGFTSISEKLSPEEIVRLLNEYLTAMTDIILKHGGTVDKYEGDAIVAFFGAPIPHPDHAKRCCEATVDMQKTLKQLRDKWAKEGFPPVLSRMGINSGLAIIGNMGSAQRMDYTMMGDTVNVASRLEGANKPYGTYTMISESTYEEIKNSEFLIRELDFVRVVGKAKPIKVYELMGRNDEIENEIHQMITNYNNALNEFRQRNWQKAYELFKEIISKHNDKPTNNYIKRCERFIQNPPPPEWDGVFTLDSK